MFKREVTTALAAVVMGLCSMGEVTPQNLGSIRVNTPMYTAEQVDEIVAESGKSNVALTNGTIYINGETITPLPTTMNDTTATVEKLSIVYPGWDTNNIAPIRIKHNEDGSFDLQIIGTNTYLFGANGANLYWNENSTVSLKGTNELSGYTRITQDFVAPAFRIPRNEWNLHAKRKFRFDESANARIEIGGQGEMRVDSPDYIKFGGIDWSENLWNASNKTLTAYISDRLEDFSKNGTVPAIKSNDGSYMIDATGCVWRITLLENISDWVLGGDGYLTTSSDNYPTWYYSTRWNQWYWTVTNNESVITIDMPAEGWSAQYMVDVNYDYYASSLGMWLLYETDEEYEDLIQKGFPEDLDFTRTVVRYFTTNLVGKIALEEDVNKKRNYNDISVDTNTWYLLKPDLSVEPMIFAQQTHRYIRWSTEDGNFDLNIMFSDSTWALTVNRGHTILVTNSMDVTSLEFTNYVPPYETYHVIRGSRLVLNTEIPQDYSTVSNAAMNSVQFEDDSYQTVKIGSKLGFHDNFYIGLINGYELTFEDGMAGYVSTLIPDGSPVATSNMVEGVLDTSPNVVHIEGDEQILGSKTFLNGVTVSSASNPPFTISTRDSDHDYYNISWGIYDDFWGFRFGMIGIDDPTINTIKFPFKSGTLAIDGDVVHKLGNESISGVKTFTQNVVINASLRNGNSVTANGSRSHAQGLSSTATGDYSHAEGDDTKAIGAHSHAEGYLSEARGIDSHAEGHSTIASGKRAHAEGFQTSATNNQSHAEGRITVAGGYHSHAEGRGSIALGDQSHAEGAQTIAAGHQSHTDGFRAMSAEQGESVTNIVNPHAGAYVWQGMPDTVSLVTDIAAEDALTPDQRLTPEELTNTYYHSHGIGTFNINPVGGLEGFWIGETNFIDNVANLTAGKRDYDDISVNTNNWLLTKPDGTQVWLGKPDPQQDTWTGDGFTLVYETIEAYWGLVKLAGGDLVVDDSDDSPPDATRLEFRGSDDTSVYRLVRGSRFAFDTETKGYLPLTGGTLIGDLFATQIGSDVALIAQDSTNSVAVGMGVGSDGLWPLNKENDTWGVLSDYCFWFDRNNERWTLSGFAIEKETLSEETSTLSFEMDSDNNWQLNIANPSETTPGDTDVYTLTLPLTNGTIATTSDLTASRLAVFSSPQQQLDGWTLPEYISALSKYKWDTQSRTCYREFVENDMLILRAVTNIDLTAVGNIDALKAMEDSIEIRKPPVAQTCYSVGYASLTNVLVATNANFKIDGNYLTGADITISYDVSGTTTTAIISPSLITAAAGSITIAESALATARSEIGRTITFTIQTAYGHTSITAVVAAPPTP